MNETELPLQGPAGTLEARLGTPDDTPRLVAVVAHPHPLYGGTMDNMVVHVATQELLSLGATTLRFNFRGVGRSTGEHDQGRGEAEDLAAAEAALVERHPELPLWLVGYSFGSVMVLRRLEADTRARAVTLLAPPVTHYDASVLETTSAPVGLILGSADDIAPAAEVSRRAEGWPSVTHSETLEPAGHDLGTAVDSTRLADALRATFGALAEATGAAGP